MTDRVACKECGGSILASTSEKTGGLCMPCKKGFRTMLDENVRAYEEEKARAARAPDFVPPLTAEKLALSDIRDVDAHCCIGVDWREYEELIIEDFASRLEGGDVLEAVLSEDGEKLTAVYNGVAHAIPLRQLPVDRYITICSLAAILSEKYELRALSSRLGDDTHSFLLLHRSLWSELDERYPDWSEQFFEPLKMGIDGFSGEKIPHVGDRKDTKSSWKLWAGKLPFG